MLSFRTLNLSIGGVSRSLSALISATQPDKFVSEGLLGHLRILTGGETLWVGLGNSSTYGATNLAVRKRGVSVDDTYRVLSNPVFKEVVVKRTLSPSYSELIHVNSLWEASRGATKVMDFRLVLPCISGWGGVYGDNGTGWGQVAPPGGGGGWDSGMPGPMISMAWSSPVVDHGFDGSDPVIRIVLQNFLHGSVQAPPDDSWGIIEPATGMPHPLPDFNAGPWRGCANPTVQTQDVSVFIQAGSFIVDGSYGKNYGVINGSLSADACNNYSSVSGTFVGTPSSYIPANSVYIMSTQRMHHRSPDYQGYYPGPPLSRAEIPYSVVVDGVTYKPGVGGGSGYGGRMGDFFDGSPAHDATHQGHAPWSNGTPGGSAEGAGDGVFYMRLGMWYYE